MKAGLTVATPDGDVPIAQNARIPFFSLHGMVAEYRDDFMKALSQELDSATFILGKSVSDFEEEFASTLGVEQAIGVSNGLDALSLSLAGLEIGAGDEVILPTNSFIATALAVSSVGAKPVLVDCGMDHLIDVERVGAAVNSRTKAIIPVHLFGQPAAMTEMLELGERANIPIVEDAAQAHGAIYQARHCGTLGRLGCFSFYPTKNLGALGDGGMITTNDKSMAQRIRRLANYGKKDRDVHVERGSNKRLDSLQASFLRVLLADLAGTNRKRANMAQTLADMLQGCQGLILPQLRSDCQSAWHLFVVRHIQRDRLREALAADGIETLVHYSLPIHLQPAYSDLGYAVGDFLVAELLAQTMVSLPFHPWLSDYQVCKVAHSVKNFCASSH